MSSIVNLSDRDEISRFIEEAYQCTREVTIWRRLRIAMFVAQFQLPSQPQFCEQKT